MKVGGKVENIAAKKKRHNAADNLLRFFALKQNTAAY